MPQAIPELVRPGTRWQSIAQPGLALSKGSRAMLGPVAGGLCFQSRYRRDGRLRIRAQDEKARRTPAAQ